jgi:hypothetical protein
VCGKGMVALRPGPRQFGHLVDAVFRNRFLSYPIKSKVCLAKLVRLSQGSFCVRTLNADNFYGQVNYQKRFTAVEMVIDHILGIYSILPRTPFLLKWLNLDSRGCNFSVPWLRSFSRCFHQLGASDGHPVSPATARSVLSVDVDLP